MNKHIMFCNVVGANLEHTYNYGLTALLLAAQNGHFECLQLLMQQGVACWCDVKLIHSEVQTPTSLALLNMQGSHAVYSMFCDCKRVQL